MKTIGFFIVIPLVLMLLGNCAFAQLQDDFSDGDFTSNPTWTGTASNYAVNNGILELNDQSGSGGQSALSASCNLTSLVNQEWRIWIDQNLAGSASNQSRIYLASNGAALSYSGTGSSGVEGYYLLLGEALSGDVIRFYYDDGTNTTLLASGQTSISTGWQARIKITVDNSNNWSIAADFTGGENFVEEVAFVSSVMTSCTHFSIINTYTSSNANNFSFDDIYAGPIVVDYSPPSVVSVTPTSLSSLDILFNETLNTPSAATAANYTIVNVGSALSATIDANNAQLVHITTPSFSPNTEYTLGVQQIADLAGNVMTLPSLVPFTFVQSVQASYRDVVFNEILADPTPAIALPEAEFVELFNIHPTASFQMEGWKFVNTNTEKILPNLVLGPGQHVILCDNANASLFTPYGMVIGITAFSSLTNTGDSLTLKDNNNQIIDVVVYSDDWFATTAKRDGGWSLELVNPSLPCPNAANWQESMDDNGGTPGTVNSQYSNAPDTTQPTVIAIEVIDANHILVHFSEPMNIDGWISPMWDVLPFNSTSGGVWSPLLDAVTLQLTFPLQPSNFYQLQVSGIADCSGNVIAAASIEFALGITPVMGDIVINEIMADPDPTLGMPQAEYIEIRNNTSNLLDLSGLQINSGTFSSNVTIAPNGFLVIADTQNNTGFDSIPNAVFMDAFPSLTNSGLLLQMRHADVLLDELEYDITWYRNPDKTDGGWSLERVNPLAPCSGRYNWGASYAETGGTAGEENSIYGTSSNGAPEVTAQGALNNTTLYVSFSESMDTLSFNAINADLGSGIQIASHSWNIDRDVLTMITSSPLIPEINYSLALLGLSDCDGSTWNAPTVNFVIGFVPQAGDVIINEIMADGSNGNQIAMPGVDFIELYNTTNHLVDLSALKINSGYFENQVLLFPDSFIVITDSDSDPTQFEEIPNVVYMPSFPSLTEDGITLELRMDGNLLEVVTYSKAYYNDASKESGGWSMERVNPSDPCNSSDNWKGCSLSSGSTAGRTNSVLDRSADSVAPELSYVLSEPTNGITLVFNEPIDGTSLSELLWTVDGNVIPIDASIGGTEYNEVVLMFGEMTDEHIYHFALSGVRDCWGNEASALSESFAAPKQPAAGHIIVNEILYDPFDGGEDFIEIYNNSAHAVSLDSCAIADASGGEMNTPDFITERHLLLMPGEFLILTQDGRSLNTFYDESKMNRVWNIPTMSDFSSDDVVHLLLPDGTLSDIVAYNSTFHFALLTSTNGVSLERLDYNRPSDDVTNWHSASELNGFATPGFENSQAEVVGADTEMLLVSPAIFSPDNDGYNDVVNFVLQLKEPGFVGNIHIYDSEGRPVRHLMQNELLGNLGTLSWDGLTDDKQKASIGAYVIFFEAFSTTGEVVKSKSSCVLAHPLH